MTSDAPLFSARSASIGLELGPLWPVADDVFSLRASTGRETLLVGESLRTADTADRLAARGLASRQAPTLIRRDLTDCAVVVLLAHPDQPMPACAAAVLAARRLLVVPRARPTFGLLEGIDHVAFADDVQAADLATAGAMYPEAFAPVVAAGAITARAHRAPPS